MRNNIDVSVIVPIYNTQDYLEACLNSLIHQTLESIELILVDDGSTDNSGRIAEDFAQKYPEKIRLFQQKNGGQAKARNLGLSIAEGKYVGFVDSDDVVAMDMYEQMYQEAEYNQADLVECGYRYCKIINNEEFQLPNYGTIKKRTAIQDFFIDPLVSPWNKLYRRQLVKKTQVLFPEGLIYEDTAFYLNLLPWIEKTAFVEANLVTHYARTNSTQTLVGNMKVGDMLTVIEKIINYYQLNGFWKDYYLELEYFCVKILLCSCLGRINSLGDRSVKQTTIRQLTALIAEYFPNYKKNPYLNKGMIGTYIKMYNRWTAPFFSYASGKAYQWKMTRTI